jgi:hypothetical protein
MRDIIADLVAIELPADPLSVDWAGTQGRTIAETAIASAYELLSALENQERE